MWPSTRNNHAADLAWMAEIETILNLIDETDMRDDRDETSSVISMDEYSDKPKSKTSTPVSVPSPKQYHLARAPLTTATTAA
jgi:hypothetical protein